METSPSFGKSDEPGQTRNFRTEKIRFRRRRNDDQRNRPQATNSRRRKIGNDANDVDGVNDVDDV